MLKRLQPSARLFLVLGAAFLCSAVRPDSVREIPRRLEKLPPITLWSWERREDLRAVDPRRFAVAYLDQTLTIDLSVHRQPRREPILFPLGATRIAVVRIETTRFAVLDEENRKEAVDAVLASAAEPAIAALQVDFDATLSQRGFYRDVLLSLRQRMRPGLPLSITALASWCSWDDWIRGLPVDEAVPMFFRMEPDRRRGASGLDAFVIREPLCEGSAGVSTTEPWPALEHKRVYIFADHGWRNESLAGLEERLP